MTFGRSTCEIDVYPPGEGRLSGVGLSGGRSESILIILGLGDSMPGVVGRKGASTSVINPPISDALISADRSASFSQLAKELRSFTALLSGEALRGVHADDKSFSGGF